MWEEGGGEHGSFGWGGTGDFADARDGASCDAVGLHCGFVINDNWGWFM